MSKIDTLEPLFKTKIEAILLKLKTFGFNCVITSARRTIAEQNKLYAQGRTSPGEIVTKAKGGQSPHNFGLAADICPLNKNGDLWWNAPDDVWHAIHNIVEDEGFAKPDLDNSLDSGYDWNFKDSPHIEDPNWKVAQAAWKAGKLEVA